MHNAKLSLMLVFAILAGCQRDGNVYGSLDGQRVVGNDASVVISNVGSGSDAFPIAEEYCQQYGRKALFKSSQGYRVAFDCV